MAAETVAYKMGDHEAWRTEYNGHDIRIVNKGRTRLLIDGEEAAVKTGRLPIATKLTLIGTIKDTGELVIATLNGSVKNEYKGMRTEVHIYVGRELQSDYGFVNPENVFTHVDEVKTIPTKEKQEGKIQDKAEKADTKKKKE